MSWTSEFEPPPPRPALEPEEFEGFGFEVVDADSDDPSALAEGDNSAPTSDGDAGPAETSPVVETDESSVDDDGLGDGPLDPSVFDGLFDDLSTDDAPADQPADADSDSSDAPYAPDAPDAESDPLLDVDDSQSPDQQQPADPAGAAAVDAGGHWAGSPGQDLSGFGLAAPDIESTAENTVATDQTATAEQATVNQAAAADQRQDQIDSEDVVESSEEILQNALQENALHENALQENALHENALHENAPPGGSALVDPEATWFGELDEGPDLDGPLPPTNGQAGRTQSLPPPINYDDQDRPNNGSAPHHSSNGTTSHGNSNNSGMPGPAPTGPAPTGNGQSMALPPIQESPQADDSPAAYAPHAPGVEEPPPYQAQPDPAEAYQRDYGIAGQMAAARAAAAAEARVDHRPGDHQPVDYQALQQPVEQQPIEQHPGGHDPSARTPVGYLPAKERRRWPSFAAATVIGATLGVVGALLLFQFFGPNDDEVANPAPQNPTLTSLAGPSTTEVVQAEEPLSVGIANLATTGRFALNTIAFVPGTLELSEESDLLLSETATALEQQPGQAIFIEVRTFSEPTPGENLALSQRQAEALQARLAELGVPVDSITVNAMGQAQFGPSQPVQSFVVPSAGLEPSPLRDAAAGTSPFAIGVDPNTNQLRPESIGPLNELGRAMTADPAAVLSLAGYSYTKDGDRMNEEMASVSAEAAAAFLTTNHNVDRGRLSILTLGQTPFVIGTELGGHVLLRWGDSAERAIRVAQIDTAAVEFAPGSAELSGETVGVLDQLAAAADGLEANLVIGVYTSTESSDDANDRLSAFQAETVYDYLLTAGVDEQLLRVYGLGDLRQFRDLDASGIVISVVA